MYEPIKKTSGIAKSFLFVILPLPTHHGNAFRGTEAIFEFYLSSRDMTEKCAIFAGLSGPDLSPQKAENGPISRHPGRN